MAWQSGTIDPATTSPATDISKITNDLSVLKGVLAGTPDTDVPVASNSKTTPADADSVLLVDSAASNATKKLTWANMKAALGSIFGALATANTWLAQQTPMNGALTDGATIDWNGNTNGQVVTLTLGGNRTMNAPTNIKQYTMYVMRIAQDGTGSRTLAWNAAFKFGTAAAPTLTTTASKVDVLMFIGGATNTLEYIGCRLDAV